MKRIRYANRGACMFFSQFFWSLFFIVGGVSLILNSVFGFHLPLFHVMLALLFFYLGLKVLFGPSHHCSWRYTSWAEPYESQTGPGFYSIRKNVAHIQITDTVLANVQSALTFHTRKGQAFIDLTQLSTASLSQKQPTLTVYNKTRAGQTVFTLNKDIPVEIHATSSWGSTKFPDHTEQGFGTRVFKTHEGKAPLIIFHSEVTGGNVTFVTR